ncbi:MAG: VWA domain-containing protein [Cytophagales bacterium]
MPDLLNDYWAWFSIFWFKPEVLKSFSWANPEFFYALLIIPLMFFLRWLFFIRLRQKLEIALPKKDIKWQAISLLRFIPDVIFSLFIALIIIALARPQKTNESVEQWTEGIDIMLVLDISESMDLQDFRPNRLEAAKNVAREFIEGRFQDRIGLVVFSGEAYSLAPLTTDYELLYSNIDDIHLKMIQKSGTAIGSALGVAVNRMRESDTKSKVMILLSDGESNVGNIDPVTAAELAAAYGIKIYTIGVGKEGKVPYGKDFFGRTQYVESSLDESTLRQIAYIGSGKFFRASNNDALEEIFLTIDKYEKAEIKETRYKDTMDYYMAYLIWAICVFLFWLLLKNTFLFNALED